MSYEPDSPRPEGQPDAQPDGQPDDAEPSPLTAEPPPFGPPPSGAGMFIPPPPAPPVRRLVRDPYSRLGGVASGVAHYYGLDVSLVRLLFVILALSTGVGILAYFLAWIIIPRADHWPPAGPPRPLRSLSNRDIGIGLAVVGALIAIALGGGDGGFLIPLVLIGGGVWLLIQPDSGAVPAPAAAGDTVFATAAAPAPPAPAPSSVPGSVPSAGPAPYTAPSPGPVGAPVAPRSRRRRLGIGLFLGFLVALVLVPLLIAGGLLVAVARNGIHVNNEDSRTYVVDAADDLPLTIDSDAGDVVIDLSGLTATELTASTEPLTIDARLDFGSIEVIIPDGIEADIDAAAQVGNVELFDRTDDGFRPHLNANVDNPDLSITLDTGAGEVIVRTP